MNLVDRLVVGRPTSRFERIMGLVLAIVVFGNGLTLTLYQQSYERDQQSIADRAELRARLDREETQHVADLLKACRERNEQTVRSRELLMTLVKKEREVGDEPVAKFWEDYLDSLPDPPPCDGSEPKQEDKLRGPR